MKTHLPIIRKALLIGLVFLLLFTTSAIAATYYVAPQGSDSNLGTEASPWRNIQKAAYTMVAGDTCIVKDGTYTDTDGDNYVVKIRKDGTPTKWITFRAENKGGAVIDGQNGTTGSGFLLYYSDYIRIEGFKIKNFDVTGIYLGSVHDIYIYQNEIWGNGRHYKLSKCVSKKYPSGVTGKAENYNITYDTNLIHDIGKQHMNTCCEYDYKHDHGLYLIGKNHLVKNNIFYNFYSGWPIKVSGHAGDPITGPTHVITNNIFAHDANDGVARGCYDSARGHIWLTAGQGAIKAHDIIIQNNVFYNPPGNSTIQAASNTSSILDTAVIRNNVTSSTNLISGISGSPSLSANITGLALASFGMANPDSNDFTLTSSASYLIDKGIGPNAPDYDHAAIARPQGGDFDIGAYEYIPQGQAPLQPSNLKIVEH